MVRGVSVTSRLHIPAVRLLSLLAEDGQNYRTVCEGLTHQRTSGAVGEGWWDQATEPREQQRIFYISVDEITGRRLADESAVKWLQ